MRPNVSRRAARRLLRLLRGEISSCGGAASLGGVREYVRGDVARRCSTSRDAVGRHGEGRGTPPRSDAQRRGRRKTVVRRVCAAVPVAGGPHLSRPCPRRARSDAPRRGRRGYFARRHAAYQPGPAELFRSEVARRHAGGPHLSRPCPRRARSDALRRVPSFLMREISVRNKISSMARTVIPESVIAPAIK